MREKNINPQVHYIPITKQPFYRENYPCDESLLPNAYKFYENMLSMPIYYSLKNDEQEYIINNIKSILE